MRLSSANKIKLVDDIYQDFLSKVRDIEATRDAKISALFKRSDNEKVTQILKNIKSRG